MPTVLRSSDQIDFVAITKFKHAEIYTLIKRLGWNQSDFGRETGLPINHVNEIINLVRRPTSKEAEAIQKAFANKGEYLDVLKSWPETFLGLNREIIHEQTLHGNPEALSIPASEYNDTDLEGALEKIMSVLTEQEREVLKLRWWKNETLTECAKKLNVSHEQVRRREAGAIRKLQHPEHVKKIISIILHDELPPHDGKDQDLFDKPMA